MSKTVKQLLDWFSYKSWSTAHFVSPDLIPNSTLVDKIGCPIRETHKRCSAGGASELLENPRFKRQLQLGILKQTKHGILVNLLNLCF